MDFHLFKKFDKFTQIELTLEKGVIVGTRIHYDNPVFLFSLDKFYVELTCLEDEGEILSIFISDDLDILNPYLSSIELPEF